MGRSVYGPLDEWFDPTGDDETNEFAGHWREYSVTELVSMVRVVGFQVLEKGWHSSRFVDQGKHSNMLWKVVFLLYDTLTSHLLPGTGDAAYVICRK